MNKRTPTKQKLLNILKKENECSMKEIMENFSISEVAIRRHLRDLIQQDLVKERTVKQEIGRPYHLYELTKKGHDTFPNQYEQLPLEILKDIETLHGSEGVSDLLGKRKERELDMYQKQLKSHSLDERIEKMIEIQSERGYMPEFERTPEGDYKIKNYNCPIYNIASSYGEICRNEKDVLKRLFPNSEVISHSQISKGEKYCSWTIKKPCRRLENESK